MSGGMSNTTSSGKNMAASKVLIVGGGIAGMSAALALHAHGVHATLVDVDPNWRVYGAGISITGMSLRAFDDLGVLPAIRERGYVHGGMRPRKMDGSDLGQPKPPAPEGSPPVMLGGGIMRPVLHDILSSRVREADIPVRLGLSVASFEQDDDGVDVTMTDGSTGRYDLMVGADGIFSKMRPMLFPDAPKPRFTGQGCWRFVAERPPEVDRAEIYFGGPFKMGMAPISKTQVYVYVLEHVPGNPWFAPETHVKHLSDLIEPFGGNVPAVRASLGADSQIVYRPLEWLLLEGPWFKGRVVLIGDAAHATTPHMACGAGSAAEDGLVLADELAKGPDLQDALQRFMTRRFDRARLVVDNSVRMGEAEMRTPGVKALDPGELAALQLALQQPY
jgi:2-polyprenyl-6-methoxyphenol hydroxylase-like FAD-dependent oxidoreductase